MPPTQRIQHEPAYLLHRRKYLDDSFLVDCLTATHGRVTLVAKAAAKSRNAGALQIGQPLEIAWQQSGELGQLQSAEPSAPAFSIRPTVLPQLWTMHDECIRLLPRLLPVPDLFLSYAVAVPTLNSLPDPALSLLEFSLLQAIGQLHLPERIDTDAHYIWQRMGQGGPWQALPAEDHPRSAQPSINGHCLAQLLTHRMDGTDATGAIAALRPTWAQMLAALPNASPLRSARAAEEGHYL